MCAVIFIFQPEPKDCASRRNFRIVWILLLQWQIHTTVMRSSVLAVTLHARSCTYYIGSQYIFVNKVKGTVTAYWSIFIVPLNLFFNNECYCLLTRHKHKMPRIHFISQPNLARVAPIEKNLFNPCKRTRSLDVIWERKRQLQRKASLTTKLNYEKP